MTLLRQPRILNLTALLMISALFGSAGCEKRPVCDGTTGGCLALRVLGEGSYDALVGTLRSALVSYQGFLIGTTDTNVTLPITLRIPPPPGIKTSEIRTLLLDGMRGGARAATGTTPLNWPDGAIVEASLSLEPTGLDVDMGPADLTPPPQPVWRTESTPGSGRALLDVWASSTPGGDVIAVGEAGLTFERDSAGVWSQLVLPLPALRGIYGEGGGIAFAAVESGADGAVRHNAGWFSEGMTGFPTMAGPGSPFYCITRAAASGEYWAGDAMGRLWHRTGLPDTTGKWANMGAVFGTSVPILSVAFAGLVFASSSDGQVAWTRTEGGWQHTALPGFAGGKIRAVWAFDQDNAVAVGDGGKFVRFNGGTWGALQLVGVDVPLNGVWGVSANRFWIVAGSGHIFQVEGNGVYKQQPTLEPLNAIFGVNEQEIYAVGGPPSTRPVVVRGTPQ